MIHKLHSKINKRKLCITMLIILISYAVISFLSTAVICKAVFKSGASVKGMGEIQKVENNYYKKISVNKNLNGYLLKSENKKIVLLVGGISSNPDTHIKEVRYFLNDGWDVFVLDSMHTESNDILDGFCDIENDITDSINVLKNKENYSVDSMVICGHSAGGYGALCAADNVKGIGGAVGICSFNSSFEMMAHYGRKNVGFLADIQYPFLYLYQTMIFGNRADDTAVECINNTDSPVMVVESPNDKTVLPQMGIMAQKESIKNKNVCYYTIDSKSENAHNDLLTLNGDDSKFGLNAEHMDAILDFMNSAVSK